LPAAVNGCYRASREATVLGRGQGIASNVWSRRLWEATDRARFPCHAICCLLLVLIALWPVHSAIAQELVVGPSPAGTAGGLHLRLAFDQTSSSLTFFLRNPGLLRLTIIGTVLLIMGNTAGGGIQAWAPTYLQVQQGLDISTVGWLGVVQSLGLLLGYNAAGWVADALSRRYSLMIFFGLGVVSLIVFGLVSNLVLLGVALFVVGVSTGGQFGNFIVYVSELFPTQARASGVGWCMGIGLFFWALVPLVLSSLAPTGNFDLERLRVVRRVAVHEIGATVDQGMSEADLLVGHIVAPVGAQWIEATATSPGRFVARTWVATRRADAWERFSSRLTPGRSLVAPHCRGMPLLVAPSEKTSTRALPGTSTTAGAAASWLAPARAMLARSSARSVSASPAYPQSSTWLFARAQQSMRAATRHLMLWGCMR
jgi:MFS family permease